MKTFYSNGKLLIAGEYVVLDGALAFAVPTKFGQRLKVESINENKIYWKSFNSDRRVWFEGLFEMESNGILKQVQYDEISGRIVQILNAAKSLNPIFLNSDKGYKITTELNFPKNWGLGTSSTLINNIASWAKIDAYNLLQNTFGGSGYDIACAQKNQPLLFHRTEHYVEVNTLTFNPDFKDHLYFVYLNQKQNSREGIANYNANKIDIASVISEINEIVHKMINSQSLKDFETLLTQHENIISKVTKQATVKSKLFPDFDGCIKSLGAWGGDFVLVTSVENPTSYFRKKGYHTILSYSEMVL